MPICREKPLPKIHDNLFFFFFFSVWSQSCKDCQSQSQNQSNPTLNHTSFHFHCSFCYTVDHSGCCSWSQSSALYCRDKREFALTPANNLDFPAGLACVWEEAGAPGGNPHRHTAQGGQGGHAPLREGMNPQPSSCDCTTEDNRPHHTTCSQDYIFIFLS